MCLKNSHDVDIGLETATNAVENNFLPMIVWAVASGISTGVTLYDAYQQAFVEEDVGGAVGDLVIDGALNLVPFGFGNVIKGAKKGLEVYKTALTKPNIKTLEDNRWFGLGGD